jgi:hypothetical protein
VVTTGVTASFFGSVRIIPRTAKFVMILLIIWKKLSYVSLEMLIDAAS